MEAELPRKFRSGATERDKKFVIFYSIFGCSLSLLHCNTLGQVSWLIHMTAAVYSNVV